MATVARDAMTIATDVWLSAMDALHVSAANLLGCAELITTERPGSPIYRNRSVQVIFVGRMKGAR